ATPPSSARRPRSAGKANPPPKARERTTRPCHGRWPGTPCWACWGAAGRASSTRPARRPRPGWGRWRGSSAAAPPRPSGGDAAPVARLRHPHIVQVHQVGMMDGLPFLALEYLGGGSLARRLGGAPQPPGEAAAVVETLARAVHHAHERGVVHRDLKPANILL